MQARVYDQWGMLQGDASQADWSCIAATGWTNPRRRARRGRDVTKEGQDEGATAHAGGAATESVQELRSQLEARCRPADGTRARDPRQTPRASLIAP